MTVRASDPNSEVPRRSPERGPWGAPSPRSCGRPHQGPHPDQVVGRGPEEEGPVHQGGAPVPELPEAPDGLQPVKDLLDALPVALANRIPRVAGGAAVDGAPAATVDILGDMGRDCQVAIALDEGGSVVPLVASERGAILPRIAVARASAMVGSEAPTTLVAWAPTTRPWRFSMRTSPASPVSWPAPCSSGRAGRRDQWSTGA